MGSAESRAAARALAENADNETHRLQVISHIAFKSHISDDLDPDVPHVGEWQPMLGGGFMRVVYVPPDTPQSVVDELLASP